MAKNNDVGLKQLPNGNWSCRIFKKINGVQIDTTCRVDERTGEPFTTKTQARNYREYKIAMLRNPDNRKTQAKEVKFSQVWKDYLESDSKGKAPSTVKKHSSLWENHVKAAFGERYISGENAVSTQEINNYLRDLYLGTDLTYAYIEGFLRLFYLLYGLAYRRNYIDLDTLHKFTKAKSVRIEMPAKTVKDEEESGKIEIYNEAEIEAMAKIFEGTDLEPAFLLGIYCGLRESEIFGLLWEDVDFEKKTLTINKQLVIINGCWCLTRVKTLTSNRTIDLPDNLVRFLVERKKASGRAQVDQAYRNRANEIVLDMRDKSPVEIVGGNFINRKLYDGLAGKLLTINSFKFYARKIQNECGFSFKTHKLRKTHLSYLASHGYPLKSLMERAGHKKLETSMRYYISQDETMRSQALRIINQISLEDSVVNTVDYAEPITGKAMRMRFRKSGVAESEDLETGEITVIKPDKDGKLNFLKGA